MHKVSFITQGKKIDFSEIGTTLLGTLEFKEFVGKEYFAELSKELINANGNSIRMAKCVRELMAIDVMRGTSEWGPISNSDMITMQGGILEYGEAFGIYCQYVGKTGRLNSNIEAATRQIEELEKQGATGNVPEDIKKRIHFTVIEGGRK